ncbi:MAG: MBL fold metallo-hydrolase [Myxococcales bacterium]|nr:MBL fold metallo-hydrolase [Myxococcales bacterium]
MQIMIVSLMLTWYGHATFTLAADGATVVIDPYTYKAGLFTYPTRRFTGDVVTISHNHFDHSNLGAVRHPRPGQKPLVLRGLTADGKRYHPIDQRVGKLLRIRSVNAYHDEVQGKKRGLDAIFVYEMPGLRIAHLGDLGQKRLSPEQLKAIGAVDVVLAPIGGYFTAPLASIKAIVGQLDPWIVIPMHYKTTYTQKLPISGQTTCPATNGSPPPNVFCLTSSHIDLVAWTKRIRSAGKRQVWLYLTFVK